MKNLIKVVLIALIGLTLFSCQKEDQLPANMINYTTKDGLFNNYVNNIAVDGHGNVLVGCGSAFTEDEHYEGGLSKFDGENWVTYHQEDGVVNDWILSMTMDKQGICWIGTNRGGVSKFDGTHWTSFAQADHLSSSDIWSIAIDEQGNKWFGSSALNKFDGEHWETYTTGQVAAIMPDKQGNIWLGTGSTGLWKLDQAEKLNHYVIPGKEYNGYIKTIAIDSQGNKWCSNGVGVSKFDGTDWTTYTTREGLPANEVSCIVADQQGNIWVGTTNGLSKFDGLHWINYLSGKHVHAMTFDAMGHQWIGTMGNGVFYWKNDSGK